VVVRPLNFTLDIPDVVVTFADVIENLRRYDEEPF